MFKKLLTNLPFNPSLLGQVNFYTQRLRNEAFVRGVGLSTLVLALVIQTFAVISPPQHSLARSTNDILYGGFTTKTQVVQHCVNDDQDFKKILDYYGVSCAVLSDKGVTTTIKSTDHNKQLDSLGRNPQPATNAKNGKPSDQYEVKIPGVGTFYMKNLWYWDTYSYSSYKVIQVTNKYGNVIYVMYDCGNIVTVGKYTPPAPPAPKPAPKPTPTAPTPAPKPTPIASPSPTLSFEKKARNDTKNIANADGTVADPANVIIYTLTVKNSGDGDYKNFVFDENLNDVLEYADMNDFGGGTLTSTNHLVWPARTVAAGQTQTVSFAVKVKSPIPSTPQSSSDPASFDLCMANVFFDKSVTICVKAPVSKQVEAATTTLPNTGPGTSLMVTFGIVAMVGYFFARNRLMVEELVIVRDEFSAGGPA